MSNKRDTDNAKFRNAEHLQPLKWQEFRELLIRQFPERNLKLSMDPDGTLGSEFKWAKNFYNEIERAFTTAEMHYICGRSPDKADRSERLAEVADRAERLIETLTGLRLEDTFYSSEPDSENSIPKISVSLNYALSEAIGRETTFPSEVVTALSELVERAKLAQQWVSDYQPLFPSADQPSTIGRPRSTGETFNDALVLKLMEVWNRVFGEVPWFKIDNEGFETSPFCTFFEKYFGELGQKDSAENIRNRCLRAKKSRDTADYQ